jgi:hypothetical protein
MAMRKNALRESVERSYGSPVPDFVWNVLIDDDPEFKKYVRQYNTEVKEETRGGYIIDRMKDCISCAITIYNAIDADDRDAEEKERPIGWTKRTATENYCTLFDFISEQISFHPEWLILLYKEPAIITYDHRSQGVRRTFSRRPKVDWQQLAEEWNARGAEKMTPRALSDLHRRAVRALTEQQQQRKTETPLDIFHHVRWRHMMSNPETVEKLRAAGILRDSRGDVPSSSASSEPT